MKSYFRYAPSGRLGVICSPEGPVIFDQTGKLAFTTSVESVGVWNLRQASSVCSLNYEDPGYPYSDRGEVTSLSLTADSTVVCAGYSTGEIRLFDYVQKNVLTTFRGHRSVVSALAIHPSDSAILASGSGDCSVVLWDLVTRTGVARLVGHKDMVTSLGFVRRPHDNSTFLVSASKDTLLKVWDTVAMTCVQTIVGHRSEIWSLAVLSTELAEGIRLFSAGADDLVRVYALSGDGTSGTKEEDGDVLSYRGAIKRSTSDRCVTLAFNPSQTLLAAQSAGKCVDFIRIFDSQHAKKRAKRRAKREDAQSDGKDVITTTILEDEIELAHTLKCSSKIRSFAFSPKPGTEEDLSLLAMTNNTMELFKVTRPDHAVLATRASIIDLQGHRSDIRGICISGDDNTLATCSAETIKVWSAQSGQCVGTCRIEGYALSIAFAPGGRYLLVGSKSGALQLVDVASGEAVQSLEHAHDGAIWSIGVRPDGVGFSTASADKMVKQWVFELKAEGLRVHQERQLATPSDVLCVRYSHGKTANTQMFATAQLDNNVRIFFQDSLKLYLTLYGHKLPVLSLDISYDNALLVSGSADKTVKIWGMDFGDCHRSLFAHDDSVTCVRFVNKTHYFFSSGKDGAVKYWDADRFEQILFLPGHKGSVWGLEIAQDGSSAFSVGADRSVRLWSRQEDLVFIEEERERMLEAQVDKAAARTAADEADASTGVVAAAVATTTTALPSVDSIRSGEQLMQSVDNIEQEVPGFASAVLADLNSNTLDEESAGIVRALHLPGKSAVLLNLSPLRYLVRTLRMIKQPDLEAVLLALPFHYVQRLVVLLVQLAKSGLEVELSCRCTVFMLMCHQQQIAASAALLPAILALRDVVLHTVGSYRFLIGVNSAGLQFMQNQLAEHSLDVEAQKALFNGPEASSNSNNDKKKGTKKKRKAAEAN